MIAVHFRLAVVASGACLAAGAVIPRQTVTTDLVSFIVHLAAGGEVVGDKRQWTRTDQTVRRCAYGSVTVIALLAEFTVVTGSTVFTILQNNQEILEKFGCFRGILFAKIPTHLADSGVHIACACVAIALTRRAVSAVWTRFYSIVAWSAFFA